MFLVPRIRCPEAWLRPDASLLPVPLGVTALEVSKEGEGSGRAHDRVRLASAALTRGDFAT